MKTEDWHKTNGEATGITTLLQQVITDADRLGLKQELYNRYACEYAARTQNGAWLYAPDYDFFCSRLQLGARVLDLGCGPGRDARELSRRGMSVFGIDFANYALNRCTGIETKCLDYESQLSELVGQRFDGLWTNCTLTTTPREKIVQVVTELSALLPVGASAFFGFIEGPRAQQGWISADWKYDLPRYRFRDSREGITQLVTSCGFIPIHTRIIPRELSGKNTYVNLHCINTRSYSVDCNTNCDTNIVV